MCYCLWSTGGCQYWYPHHAHGLGEEDLGTARYVKYIGNRRKTGRARSNRLLAQYNVLTFFRTMSVICSQVNVVNNNQIIKQNIDVKPTKFVVKKTG